MFEKEREREVTDQKGLTLRLTFNNTVYTRRQWSNAFNALGKKCFKPRMLYPVKSPSKCKGKIMACLYM